MQDEGTYTFILKLFAQQNNHHCKVHYHRYHKEQQCECWHHNDIASSVDNASTPSCELKHKRPIDHHVHESETDLHMSTHCNNTEYPQSNSAI